MTTTAPIPFLKMNGLGNSFVVIDARLHPVALDAESARVIADPACGVGCDQVIMLEPAERADVFMRVFNADGSEVEACGNAARCVAWLTARDTGASAVAGRIQPRFQQALIDRGCVFRGRATYTLVHSKDENIARAFQNGTAWLSVLDGECPFNLWNAPEAASAELNSLPRYSRSLGIVQAQT